LTDLDKFSNFMKILSVEAELLHADTDGEAAMTKLIVAFRNFVNAPKKTSHITLGMDLTCVTLHRSGS